MEAVASVQNLATNVMWPQQKEKVRRIKLVTPDKEDKHAEESPR